MKCLFLSPGTQTNATGVHEVTQFSADVRSAQIFFEKLGYEVWVHDPYKAKYKSRKIQEVWGARTISRHEVFDRISEFDIAVLRFGKVNYGMLTGELNFGQDPYVTEIFQMIKDSGIKTYNAAADYRKNVMAQTIGSNWNVRRPERCFVEPYELYKELVMSQQIKTLVASKVLPEGLKPNGVVLSNFMDYTSLGMYQDPLRTPSDWSYDYLYGGVAAPKGNRLERLKALTEDIENKGLVGKLKIKGWNNITNNKGTKSMEEYAQLMGQAKLQIAFGEPWHDFATPRFWETLINGSIFGVDASWKAGREMAIRMGLGSRVLETSSDVTCLLNDNSADLYQQQLAAFDYITENLDPPILIE